MNERLGLILGIAFLLLGQQALASRVLVAPVKYRDAITGEVLLEVAKKVEDQVRDAVTEAGFELVSPQMSQDVVRTEAGGAACDEACRFRVRQRAAVDNVVFIDIDDTDQSVYRTVISFGVGQPVVNEQNAGFYVYLEWLKGKVVTELLSAKQQSDTLTEPAKKEAAGTTTQGSVASADDAAAGQSTKGSASDDGAVHNSLSQMPAGRRKLGKTPFMVALGVTFAGAAVSLIMDSAAHGKYRDVKTDLNGLDGTGDGDSITAARLRQDLDDVDSMQKGRNVAIAVTVTGAVATAVLALFTDFSAKTESGESRDDHRGENMPDVAVTDHGATLMWGRSF